MTSFDHSSASDAKNHVERLILRVRTMMDMGLTVEEIVESCKDELAGEVYLAWHAARMLANDLKSE